MFIDHPVAGCSNDKKGTLAAGQFADLAVLSHDAAKPRAALGVEPHTPVFGADGRLWELGCGCAV